MTTPLATDASKPTRWWPAFDGVRACAVAAVVLFHLRLRPMRFGEIGIDLFFVLSGFLITSLLADEFRRTGTVRLRAFWRRRILRLYPALLTLVAVLVALATVTDNHVHYLYPGAGAALLYSGNIFVLSGHRGGFFDHTWTLGIEDQFYVLWPILLFILLSSRAAGRRRVAAATAAATLAAIALLAVAPLAGPADGVRDGFVRAAGLPLGCLAALLAQSGRGPAGPAVRRLAFSAACALAAMALVAGSVTSARWLPALASPLAAVLIYALAVAPPRGIEWVLRLRPLRWLGRRSYGVYLWHVPIFDVLLFHTSGPLAVRQAVAVGASISAAALSYRYVERPFLALRHGRSGVRTLAIGFTGATPP
jgi:peptidoglycan/LPS O-acetylase OafA/YrhL